MRPLSDVLPKPALPVLDRPVVRWGLEQAAAAGVDRAVVNTWHLAGLMEAVAAGTAPAALEIAFSREPALMGGAGGLSFARDRGLLGNTGPVLVVNGDGLVELDLEPLVERHLASGDLVTLALLPHPDPLRWSHVLLDRAGRVEAIRAPGEPAPGEDPRLYPGVMLVAREALRALPSGPGETGDLLWAPALERGRMGGAVVGGRWREVGTPGDYRRAVLAALPPEGWIQPGSTVGEGVVVDRSMVGPGCRVEEGARLVGSIVAHGAVVGRETVVRDSILLGPVCVGPGEVLDGETRTAPLGEPLEAVARGGRATGSTP